LVNDGKTDYINFLTAKEKYIAEFQKDSKISIRDEALAKVLPIYEQGSF
jgi:hypothetical protein